MNSKVEPYQIAIADSTIKLTQQKLGLATFPGTTNFSNDKKRGAPLDDIKRLVSYWEEKYDWREAKPS